MTAGRAADMRLARASLMCQRGRVFDGRTLGSCAGGPVRERLGSCVAGEAKADLLIEPSCSSGIAQCPQEDFTNAIRECDLRLGHQRARDTGSPAIGMAVEPRDLRRVWGCHGYSVSE